MPFEESKYWRKGNRQATYYADDLKRAKEEQERDASYPKAIKPEEMPWEDSLQGRLKHMAREGINPRIKDIDMYMQELPPGGCSGKHRHMHEEIMYILEGRGYSLHWDIDFDLHEKFEWRMAEEPKRFDWEQGDLVWIPVNTAHQHFNSDPDKPARFISASSRIYKQLGWGEIEQLEDAPATKKGL
jgi:quercetin dioxygenase-like cupin family protein